MKRASLIASLGCILFARPAGAQSAPGAEFAPTGTLRVGVLEPNVLLGKFTAAGDYVGVVPDVMRFIAGQLGVPFVVVRYPTADSFNASIGTGEWDLCANSRVAPYTATLDYSPDIMTAEYVYIAAPGRTFADAGTVDQTGVKVGVPRASQIDTFLSARLKAANIVRTAGGEEYAIDALRSKTVDVYADNGFAAYEIAAHVAGTTIVPGTFNTVPIGFAMPKGRSPAAQNRLAVLVNQALTSGLVKSAIDRAGLKGVSVG